MKMIIRLFKHSALYIVSLTLIGLSVVSCADEDLANEQNKSGKEKIGFSVADVQDMDASAKTKVGTRASAADDGIVKIACESDPRYCFIESTVDGVMPVKRSAATRAAIKTTIDGDFGCSAYKNGSSVPDFFYNEKVNSAGVMYSPKSWTPAENTLKFYAVYPYADGSDSRQKLSPASHSGTPYVDFTVNTVVASQSDLMTASTAAITKLGVGTQVIPLSFDHALTGVKLAVGTDLPAGKTIDKVEIVGVYGSGRYDLDTKTWSNHADVSTYAVSGLNFSTTAAINAEITSGDNTFLMLPQTCPAGSKIVVTFSDNTQISAKLEGRTWAPGTTKTYKISNSAADNWNWVITTNYATYIPYDKSTGTYQITSYREDPASTVKQAIPWELVGYDADNNGTFAMSEKPAWLLSIDLTSGNGGSAAEVGTGTVQIGPLLNPGLDKNNALKNAAQRGSAGDPWDLSTHDVKGRNTARNTANCYVISAPGWYKLPLVYGNAVKNGAANTGSYIPTASGAGILPHFVDHANAFITDPYIGNRYTATSASIVWADETGLVTNLGVTGSGSNAYLTFQVPQAAIKQGNAVVAVKDAGGTIMWSWHLWVTTDDVLDLVPVTNHAGVVYKLSKETLGLKYDPTPYTAYREDKEVRVKVRQTIGPKKEATFIISKPKRDISGDLPWWQWGRKDPTTTNRKEGATGVKSYQSTTISLAIQHPQEMYWGYNEYIEYNGSFYHNLWSANNGDGVGGTAIVKTIYDPCPVGFHVAPNDAYTGFTTTGTTSNNRSEINAKEYNGGWVFYTDNTKTATIYFPSTGLLQGDHSSYQPPFGGTIAYRTVISGMFQYTGAYSSYPLYPLGGINNLGLCSVRPVAE